LRRRNSGINLVILPSPVQGESAAPILAQQIRIANLHSLGEVIILGRGGGSLEDLLPFYDEDVVRAIADSSIPIISAVGHETDTTLTDLVADVRAPTPSAAAELVSASRDELLRRVIESKTKITKGLDRRLEKIRMLLTQFKSENLERSFRQFIQPILFRFDDSKEALLTSLQNIVRTYRHKLEILSEKLIAHSPLDILKKGYAVVTDKKSGKILTSTKKIAIGDDINVRLFHGTLHAEVKEKKE
jgi:exodeoxyribonuclease VII large subunit